MPFRLNRFLCSALLAFGAAIPGFAGEAQWVEVRSPNFSVITDAGEKKGRDAALHFEQMRSVFSSLFQKAHVNLALPLQIVAFRNSKELRQFAPLWNGKPTEVSGLFQAGADHCYILLDLSAENPWQVVFHEYGHQLMNGNISTPMAPWFEEGFAEYFSSIEMDSKEARVGKIPEDTYRVLQNTSWLHIQDLFRVQHNSRTYNETGDHRNGFYAESSMVVHYIFDNQLILKTATYFELTVDKNVPVDVAMQQAYGMNGQQFDKAMRDYLGSGHYKYYPVATPAGIVASNFTATPVNTLDSKILLAEVHLYSPDYQQKAAEEFQDILKTDANQASALRGLGYAALQKKDYPQASDYFHRAVQANSQDARVHYYYAMLMYRQSGQNATNPELKKELEAAVALDPKLADAYSLLAFARMAAEDKDGAMAAAEKATALSPRNEGYLFNQAQIYITAGRVGDGIAILKRLQSSGDPAMASSAAESLTRALAYMEQVEQAARMQNSQPASMQNASTSPVLLRPGSAGANPGEIVSEVSIPVKVSTVPSRYLKGNLSKVDCSGDPAAVLTITSGVKTLRLHVKDKRHAILIGADAFSCGWTNQKVGVNYYPGAEGEGDLISLELQ
jgi:tetratricopeptide (TPR) repeat protein